MGATSKHTRSFTYQFLVGVTADVWRAMLRENRPAIERRYCHRAAFITAMSAINSFYRRREERRYGAAISQTAIDA
ncbi:MAG: sulfotransferase, partial [Chloroflexales bacterium]|nr:sulfotransferase [Chloroflexales bacterium]